jgi:dGTPase
MAAKKEKPYYVMYEEEKHAEKVRQVTSFGDDGEGTARPPAGEAGDRGPRDYALENSLKRNAFIKDRDRILYSRPFRRLEHKAQIFSHEKGDHFRTRLTHTIEVSQIARSLCRNLGLNEDLVEAVALGHDIGHTPFGHEGERVLGRIMSGEDNLGGQIKHTLHHGGFKHNYQGVKTLDFIESIYKGEKGLFLTWQTIDGILKHTKTLREDKKTPLCDVRRFAWHADFYFHEDGETAAESGLGLMEHPHPVTLEGQVVALADEIAQRQHDLDDALSDELLGITVPRVIKEIQDCIDGCLKSLKDGSIMLEGKSKSNLESMLRTFKEKLSVIDAGDEDAREKSGWMRRCLVSRIIEYFLMDATYESMENIMITSSNTADDTFSFRGNDRCFKTRIISLSKIGVKIDDTISKYINNKIVNSYHVKRFDARAVYIIRQLFKAYYANPRQMPDNVLGKLNSGLKELSRIHGGVEALPDEYEENEEKREAVNILETDLRSGSPKQVERLISCLRLEIDESFPFADEAVKECVNESLQESCTGNKLKEYQKSHPTCERKPSKWEYKLWKARPLGRTAEGANGRDGVEPVFAVFKEANYLFLSTICDYIAGMTDNFAKNEFRKLYAVID